MGLVEVLLTAFGGTVVALAVVGYLGQSFIKTQLQKVMKKYEASLNEKTEVLKTQLTIYAHEQTVGISRIDQQRSDAVLAIWELLNQWQEEFLNLTAPNRRLSTDPKLAVEKYQVWARASMSLSDSLSKKVRDHAILFEQSSYEVIATCGQAISDATNEFYAGTFEGVDITKVPDFAACLEGIDKERTTLRDVGGTEVGRLRDALIHQFRVLMNAEKPAQH